MLCNDVDSQFVLKTNSNGPVTDSNTVAGPLVSIIDMSSGWSGIGIGIGIGVGLGLDL